MSVLDAAIEVLREAGQPLHANEITKRILAKKLWDTSGKTPTATVSARLYSAIKKSGDASPFVLTSPQTFALRGLDAGAQKTQSSPISQKRKRQTDATTLSFVDAAAKVLDQFGNRNPMHYRAITKMALELGWIDTAGRTPDATMAAQIYTTIKRDQRRGKEPRFIQHGRGIFGLGKWMGHGLSYEIAQHNQQVRQALRKQLLDLEAKDFEQLVGLLLVAMDFEDILVTGRTGDGGIDVRGILVAGDVVRIRMAIQAKKWKLGNNVQAPDVQRVRGSLGTHDQGLIITTSDFSPGARKEAERPDAVPVGLMNGEQLVQLLAENEIGLARRPYDLLELTGLELIEK